MSKPKPMYSERLQMLLDRCDRYQAHKKKLEEQGVEFDVNLPLPEINECGIDKPSEKTPSP